MGLSKVIFLEDGDKDIKQEGNNLSVTVTLCPVISFVQHQSQEGLIIMQTETVLFGKCAYYLSNPSVPEVQINSLISALRCRILAGMTPF